MCQNLYGVNRHIPSLPGRSVRVDSLSVQPLCNPIHVHWRRENKNGISILKGGAYEQGKRIEQKAVTGVELKRVGGAIQLKPIRLERRFTLRIRESICAHDAPP